MLFYFDKSMDAIERTIDHAERRCKESGARFTEKRKQTLSLLVKSGKALSAYELVDVYKSEYGDTMPAMSMYRILEFLMAEGLAHRLELANKYVACEHIDCDHDHSETQFLICGQCKKVKEISINKSIMDQLSKTVNAVGFHLASPQLEMNCVCAECLSAPKY